MSMSGLLASVASFYEFKKSCPSSADFLGFCSIVILLLNPIKVGFLILIGSLNAEFGNKLAEIFINNGLFLYVLSDVVIYFVVGSIAGLIASFVDLLLKD